MDSKSSPTHSLHIVEEKSAVDPVEDLHNAPADTTGTEERWLMRKIDWRLLSWFIFLYLLSFLDRTSIGK
jgi:hypothetical protein